MLYKNQCVCFLVITTWLQNKIWKKWKTPLSNYKKTCNVIYTPDKVYLLLTSNNIDVIMRVGEK